jgi:hypothetical protein
VPQVRQELQELLVQERPVHQELQVPPDLTEQQALLAHQ